MATIPAVAQVPSEIDDSPLIGIPEIAVLCGVKRTTVMKWRFDPEAGFPKPGYFQGKESLMRWRRSEILAWRERNLLPAAAPLSPRPKRRPRS